MVVSLHSHSGQYCKHAKGNLEDVVKRAIEKGFEIYGLSEHMPRYRDCDLYPEEVFSFSFLFFSFLFFSFLLFSISMIKNENVIILF